MSDERKPDGRGRVFVPGQGDVAGERRPEGGGARVRNRTVMLSPELTGELRGVINNPGEGGGSLDPMSDLLPPMGGWETPGAAKGGEGAGGGYASPLQGQGRGLAGASGQALFSAPSAHDNRGADPTTTGQRYSAPGGGQGGAPTMGGAGSLGMRAAVMAASHGQEPAGRAPSGGSGVQYRPNAGQGLRGVELPIPGHGPQHAQVPHAGVGGAVGNYGVGNHAPRPDQVSLSARKDTKLVGFLVSFDKGNGEPVELRVGRYFITSQPTDQADFILVPDDTVSPFHAIIRVTNEGNVQVMDQLSESGSWLTREGSTEEQELAGTTVTVGHGDRVRFGGRVFTVCIIPSEKPSRALKSSGEAGAGAPGGGKAGAGQGNGHHGIANVPSNGAPNGNLNGNSLPESVFPENGMVSDLLEVPPVVAAQPEPGEGAGEGGALENQHSEEPSNRGTTTIERVRIEEMVLRDIEEG